MSNDKRIAHRTPPGLAWGLVLVTLGLAACGTERDITGGEPDRPGVSLAALTIQVRLQPSDASLASALRLGPRCAGRRSPSSPEWDRGLDSP